MVQCIPTSVFTGAGGDVALKYGTEVDYWSFGVVAYELTYGVRPLKVDQGQTTSHLYAVIMDYKVSLLNALVIFNYLSVTHYTQKHIVYPGRDRFVSAKAIDMLKQLLTEPRQRLGYAELREHSYFDAIDFDNLIDSTFLYILQGWPVFLSFTDRSKKKSVVGLSMF